MRVGAKQDERGPADDIAPLTSGRIGIGRLTRLRGRSDRAAVDIELVPARQLDPERGLRSGRTYECTECGRDEAQDALGASLP